MSAQVSDFTIRTRADGTLEVEVTVSRIANSIRHWPAPDVEDIPDDIRDALRRWVA